MKNLIYLFFIAVITLVMSACHKGLRDNNLNQTGLLDQKGNIIKDTLIYTNVANFKSNIPIWATNSMVEYVIETIVENNNTNYRIKYKTDYITKSLPEDSTDYYKIYVPLAASGSDYHTVNYKDTNELKQLWLDQIMRKGAVDGRVFAIRNRENDRGYWYENKSFQSSNPYSHDGIKDYYYFMDNGDIVYKGGDKSSKNKDILVKKFVGAVIVDYRKVTQRTEDSEIKEADKIEHTGKYTVGGIYKMAIGVNDARERFGSSREPTDGVYDFIACRKKIWFKYNLTEEDKTTFIRQFYSTEFIEVLVLNPYGNEKWENCMGLDSYYAYYGDYRQGEGAYPVKGFTVDNMPFMTDENLYLGQRPEDIIPLLTHTTTFTDSSRKWKFLAMPGHKY